MMAVSTESFEYSFFENCWSGAEFEPMPRKKYDFLVAHEGNDISITSSSS